MDTLTHALSGALAARLRARPADPQHPTRPAVWQAVTVGIVAAVFPDSDFVLGYISELTYLRGHRGVTHSLLMLPLWGLLIAWIMAGAFRLLHRPGQPQPGWKDVYSFACVSLLVHILGDFITQFGTMMFSPFSDWRFGLGTTFIIDLGVSGILLAGLVTSAIWRKSRVPAAVAAVAPVAWVGNSAHARLEAIDAAKAYAQREGITAVMVDAAPRPASPFNWTAIVFDGDNYHYAHLNTRRSEPLVATPDDSFLRRYSAPYRPIEMAEWEIVPMFGTPDTSDVARLVWNAEAFQFFRWFAMFPVFDHIEPANGEHGVCANFRDLRFETPGRDSVPFRFGLCENGRTWRLFERTSEGMRWLKD